MTKLVVAIRTLFVLTILMLVVTKTHANDKTVTIGDGVYSLTPWEPKVYIKKRKQEVQWKAIIGELGSRHIISTMTLEIVAHTVVVRVVGDCPKRRNVLSLKWVLGETLGTITTCDGTRASSDRPKLFEKAIPELPPEIIRFIAEQREIRELLERMKESSNDPHSVADETELI